VSDGYDDTGAAGEVAPGFSRGPDRSIRQGVQSYLLGLALATLLTVASFYVAGTGLIWAPGIPVALVVLAVAQIGIHLVFFLHITTSPDSTNNVLALAFGVLIVTLVVAGSLWIMAHLNQNMLPIDQIMQMQR
jgi:cytochrome o ubiquinol oxidase subunit IV